MGQWPYGKAAERGCGQTRLWSKGTSNEVKHGGGQTGQWLKAAVEISRGMVKRDGGQTGWWSNWIGWEVVSMQHIGQTKMVKRSNENGARSKSLRGSRCVHERVPAHTSGQIGQWSKRAACTSACWQDSERKRASGCDGGRGAVEGEGEGPSCLASGQWSIWTVV
jgi:hypothetical protein